MLAPSIDVRAQNVRIRRIGVLAPSTRVKEEVTLEPFFSRMRDLGWREGTNVSYIWRTADDRMETLAGKAKDLVSQQPDIIYAPPAPAAIATYCTPPMR